MVNSITANDLKTKGISAIRDVTQEGEEVVITVRGNAKYVVLPIESYNHLRECELEVAYYETLGDIKNNNVVEESVEDHIKRITDA